uniref:PXA domain-containing protein n=1 Tax=Thermogemmatispora argillosa TaxID=2045280 RepID=A0A455T4D5_9CHLR|nr:hypothetical protein KTA_15340 [Thermogemmatispora argillosa]
MLLSQILFQLQQRLIAPDSRNGLIDLISDGLAGADKHLQAFGDVAVISSRLRPCLHKRLGSLAHPALLIGP